MCHLTGKFYGSETIFNDSGSASKFLMYIYHLLSPAHSDFTKSVKIQIQQIMLKLINNTIVEYLFNQIRVTLKIFSFSHYNLKRAPNKKIQRK